MKASVVESDKAEEGYKEAKVGGNSITSTKVFEGYDEKEKDKKMKFKFHISASPGSKSLWVVTQCPVDE